MAQSWGAIQAGFFSPGGAILLSPAAELLGLTSGVAEGCALGPAFVAAGVVAGRVASPAARLGVAVNGRTTRASANKWIWMRFMLFPLNEVTGFRVKGHEGDRPCGFAVFVYLEVGRGHMILMGI